jgi:hypothetical protein
VLRVHQGLSRKHHRSLVATRGLRDLRLLHLFQEFIEDGIDLIRGVPVQEVFPR